MIHSVWSCPQTPDVFANLLTSASPWICICRSDMLWCLAVEAQGMKVVRSKLAVWHQRDSPTCSSNLCQATTDSTSPAADPCFSTSTATSSTGDACSSAGVALTATTTAAAVAPKLDQGNSSSSSVAPPISAVSVSSPQPAFFTSIVADMHGHSLYKALQDGLQQQLALVEHTYGSQQPNCHQMMKALNPQQLRPLLVSRRMERVTAFAAAFRCVLRSAQCWPAQHG